MTATATKLECVAGKRLCKPRVMPGPSGVALRHGMDCSDKPGERIDVAEEYPGRFTTMPRPRGWRGLRW